MPTAVGSSSPQATSTLVTFEPVTLGCGGYPSRRVQFAWREWQRRAGFDRLYPFHCLRHSAVTNVYRATRDLFLAQRFARHASPLTTTVYTHPGDEEMLQKVRALIC